MAKRKLSIADLERQLDAARQQIARLQKRRGVLLAEVAEIDQKVGGLQGAPREAAPPKAEKAVRKTRPGSGETLMSTVVDVLAEKGEPMSVPELCEAVKAKGYKSKSRNLKAILFAQIYRDDRIERPARGRFQLKSAAAAAPAEAKPAPKAKKRGRKKKK